jgi:molybdopterin synthase catalytic subunit
MIEIREADFSLDELVRRAKKKDVGAVVTFLGVVRDDGIESMELEAYEEAAVPELLKIEEEAMRRFSLQSLDIIHRVGSLSVGDDIVVIVCAASHRKEAFEGCRYAIEELKARVPIWKKEVTKEGVRWVGQ